MSRYLPQELIIEILSRLPVKTLLKCRCVSKTWCSLISSPEFRATHLKNFKNDQLFFRYYDVLSHKSRYSLHSNEDFPDNSEQELDSPFGYQEGFPVRIVGYCDGVFCLLDNANNGSNYRAVLWNPVIKQMVKIPEPNITTKSHGSFWHLFGFGFDSVIDDYKLVRLVYFKHPYIGLYDEPPRGPPLVEVYNLRSGFWRMANSDGLKNVVLENSSSVFLNGSSHWLANLKQGMADARNVIVLYDLGDEIFREIAVPDCLVFEECINMRVAVLNGLLSLVPETNFRHVKLHRSVWVMKEYGNALSWIKLFDFEHLVDVSRFLTFRKPSEVLLVVESRVVSYDLKVKEHGIRKTCRHRFLGLARSYYLDTFKASLVLLSEANAISIGNATGNETSRISEENSSKGSGIDKSEQKEKADWESAVFNDEKSEVLGEHASSSCSHTLQSEVHEAPEDHFSSDASTYDREGNVAEEEEENQNKRYT